MGTWTFVRYRKRWQYVISGRVASRLPGTWAAFQELVAEFSAGRLHRLGPIDDLVLVVSGNLPQPLQRQRRPRPRRRLHDAGRRLDAVNRFDAEDLLRRFLVPSVAIFFVRLEPAVGPERLLRDAEAVEPRQDPFRLLLAGEDATLEMNVQRVLAPALVEHRAELHPGDFVPGLAGSSDRSRAVLGLVLAPRPVVDPPAHRAANAFVTDAGPHFMVTGGLRLEWVVERHTGRGEVLRVLAVDAGGEPRRAGESIPDDLPVRRP